MPALDGKDDGVPEAREGVRRLQHRVRLDHAWTPPTTPPASCGSTRTSGGSTPRNFSFLTGPEPAIRDLLTQFGVIAEFRGDILDHTLATLLIDEKGRVAWRADGSQWQPKEFVERMHR